MQRNLGKVLLAALLGLTLAGCSAQSKPKSNQAPTEPKTVQFAKLANSKHQYVWIEVDEKNETVGKGSVVESILVTKNGQAQYLAFQNGDDPDFSIDESFGLGDLNKMTDQQIINKAQKLDRKVFKARKASLLKYDQDRIKELQDNLGYSMYASSDSQRARIKELEKEVSEVKETGYQKPQWHKLKVMAQTDDSGNHLSREEVETVVQSLGEPNDRPEDSFELQTPLQNSAPILQKHYTGYSMESGNSFLVVKADKQAAAAFDKKGAKNVKIDE